MPVFETPDPVSALVDVGGAVLHVRADDTGRTAVEVRPHAPHRSADVQLAERTTVELVDGRLLVRSSRTPLSRLRSLVVGSERVDLDVVLPTGSSLEVRGWGDVVVEGRLGAVEVETALGDVDLDEVGALRVKTSMGTVRVRVVDGPGDLRTSAGDVLVGSASGEIHLHTSAGDVRVEHAGSSVTARTSAGDVRLQRVVSGAVSLESTYGRLEVGVAEGTAAWLDVEARHGTVRSDLTSSDGPGDAERVVEIRATAAYGDVVLHRA